MKKKVNILFFIVIFFFKVSIIYTKVYLHEVSVRSFLSKIFQLLQNNDN